MYEVICEFRIMNPVLRQSHERKGVQVDHQAYCVVLLPTECFWNKSMTTFEPFNKSSQEPVKEEKEVKDY